MESRMEPRPAASPADLRDLRVDLLRQAVDCYLLLAYPNAQWPEAVKRRLAWPDGADATALLAQPCFERADRPEAGRAAIYALRLGNTHYPHMKLQIQPWPNAAGFLLSVNTHDQVLALDPNSPDLPAFRAIQAENQRLKEAIENAWDAAGLPTFLRYLREYIENREAPASPDHPADSTPPA
jgi:hypothetical protein